MPGLTRGDAPAPDDEDYLGVDVLEDGLGFLGVAGVVAVGGSGAAPATKPQQHSLVCKGWNIQSVGAPRARTHPPLLTPIG